jgi:myo-inositol-1(or 4)-monophosphatase
MRPARNLSLVSVTNLKLFFNINSLHRGCMLSARDLNLAQRTLHTCLQRAGHLIEQGILRKKQIHYKHAIDIMTETDKHAEELIISTIHRQFPDHAILAEESGAHASQNPSKWIIDPLDGTTNFAHTLPLCCTSIALEHDGKIVLGGVYDPFRKELFWAQKGKGAYLNKKRIHVSSVNRLDRALLCTGFPYDRWRHTSFYIRFFKAFMRQSHGTRRLGAAALDLAYVACGRFDGFWEWKLKPWDAAAGKLLVEEAGGKCSDFWGKPYSIYGNQTLASNKTIHPNMLAILKPLLRKAKLLPPGIEK